PLITAMPEPMVLSKEPVTILCPGPAEAKAYVISKVGSPEPSDTEKQLLSNTTNILRIAEMTPDQAGLYHCSYQSGHSWAKFSNPCSWCCPFDAFILIEEDDVLTIQDQSSTPKGGGPHAVFLLNHVSSTQPRTYRCCGALRNYPYVWSHPSDPLQLQVREPAVWHASAENQVQMSLAGLILLVLGVLLAEACYSCKMPLNGAIKSTEQTSVNPAPLAVVQPTPPDNPGAAAKHEPMES
ncbi:PREDICTED: leukocyte immunoglobulin-like receptor subfamily A member 6, partial [Ceratotherium simum simum]|uniref:Leukocyte immunoglobulin-like receptor subfamily A member 6 n=1 Tax=Ceratotherium simum simum TaxID=73337 RepID=A0ABM1DD05_CERSS